MRGFANSPWTACAMARCRVRSPFRPLRRKRSRCRPFPRTNTANGSPTWVAYSEPTYLACVNVENDTRAAVESSWSLAADLHTDRQRGRRRIICDAGILHRGRQPTEATGAGVEVFPVPSRRSGRHALQHHAGLPGGTRATRRRVGILHRPMISGSGHLFRWRTLWGPGRVGEGLGSLREPCQLAATPSP